MYKKLLILGLALLLGLTLAGCGGGKSRSYVVSAFSNYSGSGYGMAFDSSGNMYVASYGDNQIHRVTPGGISSRFAGDPGFAETDLDGPWGIVLDGSGHLYVSNDHDHDIITVGDITDVAATSYSVYAGAKETFGTSNSWPGTFNNPRGLARYGQILYIADYGNNKIRKIDTGSNTVSDFASLANVYSVAVDSAGNVYACTGQGNVVYKFTPAGGLPDNSYTLTTSDTVPNLPELYALAVDSHGNIFATDIGNDIIWKINPAGQAAVFAGTPGSEGLTNGPAASAKFYEPRAIAVDSQDRIYVIDAYDVIRRIALE